MSFIQHKDEIKAIHKKAIAVVMSCDRNRQLDAAQQYVRLAVKRLKQFKMVNATERKTMETIITNIEFILKIKSRRL